MFAPQLFRCLLPVAPGDPVKVGKIQSCHDAAACPHFFVAVEFLPLLIRHSRLLQDILAGALRVKDDRRAIAQGSLKIRLCLFRIDGNDILLSLLGKVWLIFNAGFFCG